MTRTVKVAVIGSGLAGLTTAHLLTKSLTTHDVVLEVHIFEKAEELGMDSSSVSLNVLGTDKEWRIDVPMRSFQGGYYPQLIAMYKKLGVKFRQADFSYSFSLFSPSDSAKKCKITTTMIYGGSTGQAGFSMPSAFSDASLPVKNSVILRSLALLWSWAAFFVMVLQIIFLYLMTIYHAFPALRSSGLKSTTFAEWTRDVAPQNFLARCIGLDVAWQSYVRDVMVPVFSAVCTAPAEDIWNHPVEEFLDYIWLTFGTHHYVVINGVRDVVANLSKDIQHVHVSASITSITADAQAAHLASITCMTPSGGAERYNGFHHVVFATQANAAVSLLNGYAASLPEHAREFRHALQQQADCMSKFHYRNTIVINHTDDTLLPDNRRDHRDLNLINFNVDDVALSEKDIETDSSTCVSTSFTMATHVLPRPEGYPPTQPCVYQTTNPFVSPREDSILSVAKLERAVLTVEAKEALQGLCQEKKRKWWQCPAVAETRLGPLQGAGRLIDSGNPGVWICGSFAFPGIPLLEGCVVSARNVVVQGVLRSEDIRLEEEP